MNIIVRGMSCKNCVKHVTEALLELDSNAKVEIDLESGKVDFDTKLEISIAEIKEIIEEFGYELG